MIPLLVPREGVKGGLGEYIFEVIEVVWYGISEELWLHVLGEGSEGLWLHVLGKGLCQTL